MKSPRLFVAITGGVILAMTALALVYQHQRLGAIEQLYAKQQQAQVATANILVNHLEVMQSQLRQQVQDVIGLRLQQKAEHWEDLQKAQLQQMNRALLDVSGQVTQIRDHLHDLAPRENLDEALTRLDDLTTQIDQSRQQVRDVMGQFVQSEDIVRLNSGGVCLIQGEYEFIDPVSGKALRYLKSREESDGFLGGLHDAVASQLLPVSIDGEGDPLRVQYTGTGFLIDPNGLIVTNRHVTEPWTISRDYRHILEAGYIGQLVFFQAFFPDQEQGFELTVATKDAEEDVALLRSDLGQAAIPLLACEEEPQRLQPGQTVIVLGYPTGFDALLARVRESELDAIFGEGDVDFTRLGENLARRGLIHPIGTRGMCGRAESDRIVYDAQTAIGGSGGPVIGSNGKVVGINTALLKGFSGTNFGIPIARVQALCEQWRRIQPTEMAEASESETY